MGREAGIGRNPLPGDGEVGRRVVEVLGQVELLYDGIDRSHDGNQLRATLLHLDPQKTRRPLLVVVNFVIAKKNREPGRERIVLFVRSRKFSFRFDECGLLSGRALLGEIGRKCLLGKVYERLNVRIFQIQGPGKANVPFAWFDGLPRLRRSKGGTEGGG